jgi:hypothetical protein
MKKPLQKEPEKAFGSGVVPYVPSLQNAMIEISKALNGVVFAVHDDGLHVTAQGREAKLANPKTASLEAVRAVLKTVSE